MYRDFRSAVLDTGFYSVAEGGHLSPGSVRQLWKPSLISTLVTQWNLEGREFDFPFSVLCPVVN